MTIHDTVSKYISFAALLLLVAWVSPVKAQTDDAFGDNTVDPIKLFERGQSEYSRGNFTLALEFYQGALKLRPEFPEAEYQVGSSLVELKRLTEAEKAYQRAIALRKDWPPPYVALATLLVRLGRDAEAEPLLTRALELDAKNPMALASLAGIRITQGRTRDAVELARRATSDPAASSSMWTVRAVAERHAGDSGGAENSATRALQLDPENFTALRERASLRSERQDFAGAIEDLRRAHSLRSSDKAIAEDLARAYESVGNAEEANKVGTATGIPARSGVDSADRHGVKGSAPDIEAGNSDNPDIAVPALERLLEANPRSPVLLARLGSLYRTTHTEKSIEYYRRASQIEPRNPDYAVGYAAALVQARRFAEAGGILKRVIALAPDSYPAHANLATVLYELKHYSEALIEYQWLLKAKPDLSVAYYFIATSYDFLGEYRDALAAYEAFLSKADPRTNQLEIDKARLRIPAVRSEISHGRGKKHK